MIIVFKGVSGDKLAAIELEDARGAKVILGSEVRLVRQNT